MDYEDLVDESEDEYEQTQDLQDAQMEQYEGLATVPQKKEDHNLYNWFWRVVRLGKIDKLEDASKVIRVGNLKRVEIGEHIISIRDAMNLANLGRIFGHTTFGNYWADRAIVNSASSMAKEGWFMDLSISQKKVRSRQKSKTSEPKKWGMFGKKKTSGIEE
jgi:hypothetical protein